MKNQPEDKFEQRLRERLQAAESQPAEGAWDRLAADLPASSPFRRYQIAALLLLGLIVGGGGWWWVTHRTISVTNAPATSKQQSPSVPPAASQFQPNTPEPSKATNRSTGLLTYKDSTSYYETYSSDSNQPANESRGYQARSARRAGANKKFPPPLAPTALQSSTRQLESDKKPQEAAPSVSQRATVPPIASQAPATDTRLPEVTVHFTSGSLVSASPAPSETPALSPSRWEVWATANPLLLYQRVTPNVSDEIKVLSLNRTTFSQDRLGLQLSAGALYHLNRRLALKAGVYYRYTQEDWAYHYRTAVADSFQTVRVDERTVEAVPVYEEQRGTVRETNHHIGGLVGVQYQLSNRWFSNVINAEVQAHPLAAQLAWYGYASYVAERKLGNHWTVYAGPSFLWNFSGAGQTGDHFVLRPYGFGAQMGIRYRLQFRQ